MSLGIRNGMGVEARRALREKWALKVEMAVGVFHSCDTHDCDSHGNRGGAAGGAPEWMSEADKRIYNKLKGSVQADFLEKARAAYKKKHGKLPPKGKAAAKPKVVRARAQPRSAPSGLLAERKKNIVDKKKWRMFPGEVGDLVGTEIQIRGQIKAEHWLTRDQFLARTGRGKDGREITALERYGKDDLHGMVVERNGRYLDPFGPGHVAIRLEQFDMAGEMLDKGRLARTVKTEAAFSVEMKTTRLASGAPRHKNRIYLLEGGKVALNVVVTPSGEVSTAVVEFADGSFADMGKVRRTLTAGGRTLTNTVIPIKDFR